MAMGQPMPNRSTVIVDPRFGPGTQLGKYELIAPIGSGGMASVILARQRGPGGFEKVVVIKVVHPHLAADEVAVTMLLDEGRLAALIDHPNVVHTYEVGEAHGTFYIVMEYLAGESLHTTIRNSIQPGAPAFHPYVAAKIVADACDGLHAAHELVDFNGANRGIVHRDISPGNIVVLYNGQVKVVDFGIAKAHGRVTSTQDGELKGKYGYMAPEQINNEPMDRRSDVFSLGVTLWEALAKRRLFQTDSVGATLMQVLQAPRVAPSTYDPNVPPALDQIALYALQPDPRSRFQTAGEMKRAIDDAIWQTRVGATEIAQYMQTLFASRMEQRRQLLAAASERTVDQVVELLTQQHQVARPFAEQGTPMSLRRSAPPQSFGGMPGTPLSVRGSAPLLPPRNSHPMLAAMPPHSQRQIADVMDSSPLSMPSITAPPPAREVDDDDEDDDDETRWGLYIFVFVAMAVVIVGTIVIYARLSHRVPQKVVVVQAPSAPVTPPAVDPSQLPTPTAGPSTPPPATTGPIATVPTVPPIETPVIPPDAAVTEVTPPTPTPPTPVPPVTPVKEHVKETDHKKVPPTTDEDDNGGKKPVKGDKTAETKAKEAASALASGDVDGAAGLFKEVLAIDRNNASAHRGLGIIYQRQGKTSKAITEFKRYLQLNPDAKDADAIQKRIDQMTE